MPDRRAIVWLDPSQSDLVRDVCAGARVEIAGAGSPARGQSGAVAAALACPVVDDLRAALADHKAELCLLFTAADFGSDPAGNDARSLAAARAHGLRVASIEPVPPAALDLNGAGWSQLQQPLTPADLVRFIPQPRLARPFLDAAEPLAAFGPPRVLAVESLGRPSEGTLGARLFAAMDVVLACLGEPETIDASYADPASVKGLHTLPPETLREIRGTMTANLRYTSGRSACILASDQAGRWNRTTTFIGASGRLRVFDDGFEWIGPDGRKLDVQRDAAVSRGSSTNHAINAISEAITQIADGESERSIDLGGVLALSQTALLSARTGQAESPATIRRMISS